MYMSVPVSVCVCGFTVRELKNHSGETELNSKRSRLLHCVRGSFTFFFFDACLSWPFKILFWFFLNKNKL